MEISIISITTGGTQLTASGYQSVCDMQRHIEDRVRESNRLGSGTHMYEKYVAIITDARDTMVREFNARGECTSSGADLIRELTDEEIRGGFHGVEFSDVKPQCFEVQLLTASAIVIADDTRIEATINSEDNTIGIFSREQSRWDGNRETLLRLNIETDPQEAVRTFIETLHFLGLERVS